PAGSEPGRDGGPVRGGRPQVERDPRLTTGRSPPGQPAVERWTTSNSRSDEPDATGRARSPECAVMAGPCSQAWNDSSVSQCVTTKYRLSPATGRSSSN